MNTVPEDTSLKPHELWEKMSDAEKLQLGMALYEAAVAFAKAWDVCSSLEASHGETNTPRMADELENLAVGAPLGGRKDRPMTNERFIEIARGYLGGR